MDWNSFVLAHFINFNGLKNLIKLVIDSNVVGGYWIAVFTLKKKKFIRKIY